MVSVGTTPANIIALPGMAACERRAMGEPGRVVVDSKAGCVELRKGSVVELI